MPPPTRQLGSPFRNPDSFFFSDMANTKSAAKRARQTKGRTLRNRRVLTAIKTEGKKLTAHLAAKSGKAETTAAHQELVSELDKAVKRGVIHKNAANRRKSRLAKKLVAVA